MTPFEHCAYVIATTHSLVALDALLPALRALPEADKATLRPRYRAARELLQRIAAAPQETANTLQSHFFDSPAHPGLRRK